MKRHGKTGQEAEFPLDGVVGTSLMATHAATEDGSLWFALNYNLTRVLGEKVQSQILQERVRGELPGARDTSAALAGTWITALAPAGPATVWAARLNVPSLTVSAFGSATTDSVPLPDHLAGSRDMTPTPHDTLIAPGWLSDGGPLGRLRSGRITEVAPRDIVEIRDGAAMTHERAYHTESLSEITTVQPADPIASLWRQSPAGAQAWWDQAGNRIVHTALGELPLTTNEGVMVVPVAPGATPPPPQTTASPEEVTDLAFTDDGALWILRHGGRRLDRWA